MALAESIKRSDTYPELLHHMNIRGHACSQQSQLLRCPAYPIDPGACRHQVVNSFGYIKRARIIAAACQQVSNRMQSDMCSKCRFFDGKISRCANKCPRRSFRLCSTLKRKVEILCSLGSGKPLSLGALRLDQIFKDLAGIDIRVALHQVTPHSEIGVT